MITPKWLCLLIVFLVNIQLGSSKIIKGRQIMLNATKMEEDFFLIRLRLILKRVMLTDMYNSDFMIHFDSNTKDFLDGVLYEIAEKHNVTKFQKKGDLLHSVRFLKNYDISNNTFDIESKIRYYLLHIVLLKSIKQFDEHTQEILSIGDSAIFICFDQLGLCSDYFENQTEVFKYTYFIRQLYSIILLEVVKDKVFYYVVCHYCTNSTNRMRLEYENSLYDEAEDLAKDVAYQVMYTVDYTFDNFHMHTFYIEIPWRDDNFKCENLRVLRPVNYGVAVECDAISGTEGSMFVELSKKLNFSYILVVYNMNGTEERSIESVKKSYVHWSVGSLTVTTRRHQEVTFSDTVGHDPVKIIYSEPMTVYKQAYHLAEVFSVSTWMVLWCVVLLQTLVVYLTLRYYSLQRQISFATMMWSIGLHLVEIPLTKNMTMVAKSTIIVWLLCCIAITTLYKAKLSSFQTSPPRDEVRRLDTLISEGYTPYVMEAESGFIQEEVNITTDSTLLKLQEKLVIEKNPCTILKLMYREKAIYIHERAFLKRGINDVCRASLSRDEMLSIRVTGDELLSSYHAWAFRDQAPYLYQINSYISTFKEAGLMKKWSGKSERNYYEYSIYFDGKEIVNNEEGVIETRQYGFFILWGCGITISLVVFVIELSYHRYYCSTSKKRNHNSV